MNQFDIGCIFYFKFLTDIGRKMEEKISKPGSRVFSIWFDKLSLKKKKKKEHGIRLANAFYAWVDARSKIPNLTVQWCVCKYLTNVICWHISHGMAVMALIHGNMYTRHEPTFSPFRYLRIPWSHKEPKFEPGHPEWKDTSLTNHPFGDIM